MESWEKEQILYVEIHDAVDRVVRENSLTYFQIFGVLEQVKTDYQMEFRQGAEDLFDEENDPYDEDDE